MSGDFRLDPKVLVHIPHRFSREIKCLFKISLFDDAKSSSPSRNTLWHCALCKHNTLQFLEATLLHNTYKNGRYLTTITHLRKIERYIPVSVEPD